MAFIHLPLIAQDDAARIINHPDITLDVNSANEVKIFPEGNYWTHQSHFVRSSLGIIGKLSHGQDGCHVQI